MAAQNRFMVGDTWSFTSNGSYIKNFSEQVDDQYKNRRHTTTSM